jgi:hypothetical protein
MEFAFAVEVVAAIIGLVALVNRFVAGFVTPLYDKFSWDKFSIIYVAWMLSGVVVFLTGMNLFADMIPNPLIGQILTAAIGGGGANILHDLTDKE